MLLMPGITSYSNGSRAFCSDRLEDAQRAVVEGGSPQTRKAPQPSVRHLVADEAH